MSLPSGVDYGQRQCFGNQSLLQCVWLGILLQYHGVNKIHLSEKKEKIRIQVVKINIFIWKLEFTVNLRILTTLKLCNDFRTVFWSLHLLYKD